MPKNSNVEKEGLSFQPLRHKVNRSFNLLKRSFNLSTLIEKMKHEDNQANGELNATILLKSSFKKILLMALHEGTEIKSFQSNDSVTFQIIEGKLKFHTRKESIILEKAHLLTLHENIKYSLTAREETVLLLTILDSSLQ